MIDYKEAAIIIQRAVESVSTETIPYSIALHRIIAQDIVSDVNMPPFDKSAVDGYACRRSDLGNKLMLKDVIRAGQEHHIVIDKNECAKIMTGAMIPAGADCVFMVEQSEISEDKMIRFIVLKRLIILPVLVKMLKQGQWCYGKVLSLNQSTSRCWLQQELL